MPFSFHPHQEKDLTKYVYSLKYQARAKRVHLIILQGPTGCGKTYLVERAAKLYSPKLVKILHNEQLHQIFQLGLSLEGIVRYMYTNTPQFLFLLLDEWVNECEAPEMDKLVKLIDLMLKKPTVPSTTVIFVTCTSTFHGNAKKLYRFLAPPKNPTKRKAGQQKKVEEPSIQVFVKHIKLYAPKDYTIEKYVRMRGIKNTKRIHELQAWCNGDVRQLEFLLANRLSYLSAKTSGGSSTVPKEVNIFELVTTVYEGGARDQLDDDASLDSSSDAPNKVARAKACVAKSLCLLRGVTREPDNRILDFLLANRDRPVEQYQSLGYTDPSRDQAFLEYQAKITNDLSMLDVLHPFETKGKAEQTVRALATHTAHLELEEYELDDSIKIGPPKMTQASLVYKHTQCKKARDAVMRACFWYPGDEAVADTLSRSDPQNYLDFLGGVLTSSECNYGNYSDRLQGVSKDDMNLVFPPAMKSATATTTTNTSSNSSAKKARIDASPEKLFMPF